MTSPQLHAFLADIKSDPDDDTPRLVLADWLDDQGDPARAEFIRVQCQQYRRLNVEDAEYRALKRRAKQLARQHGKAWKGSLPRAAEDVDFERGTLHLGTGRAGGRTLNAPWDRLAETEAAAWVTDLSVWDPSDATLVRLTRSPLLGLVGELYLTGGFNETIRRPGATALSHSPVVRHLSCLRVRYAYSPAMLPGLTEGPLLRQVRKLELGNCALGSRGAKTLAACPHLGNLIDLSLWVNSFGPEAVRVLAASPHLARLERLSLHHNTIGHEGAKALARSPLFGRLTSLTLGMCRIGNKGIEAMAAAAAPAPLTFLDLTGNCLTGRGVEALVASPVVDRLEGLGLSGNRLGDKGARALAASPRLARLKVLDLSGCGVTDAGARALASSPHLGGLTNFTLRWNTIGRDGKRALRARFGSAVRELHRQATTARTG